MSWGNRSASTGARSARPEGSRSQDVSVCLGRGSSRLTLSRTWSLCAAALASKASGEREGGPVDGVRARGRMVRLTGCGLGQTGPSLIHGGTG